MTRKSLPLAAAVLLAFAGCSMSDREAYVNNDPYAAPLYSFAGNTTQRASKDPALDPILRATDPSSAVDAYARALAAGTDKVAAEDAYVRRLIDLGLPELAARQAADLNQFDPGNGVAWAVTSYINARKNDTAAALSNIAQAVEKSPKDPFVSRIAGQLTAWYEMRADKNTLPREAADQVNQIKTAIGTQQPFVEAYDDARNIYAGVKPNPTTQPAASASSTTRPAASASSATQPTTQTVVVSPPDYGAGAEVPPTVVYPPSTYAPMYAPYSAPYVGGYTYYDDEPGYWYYPRYGYHSYDYWGGSSVYLFPHRHYRHHGGWRDRDINIPERTFTDDRPLRPTGPVILGRPETAFPQSRMIGPLPPADYTPPARNAAARTGSRPDAARDTSRRVDSRQSQPASIRLDPSIPPARNQGPKPAPSAGDRTTSSRGGSSRAPDAPARSAAPRSDSSARSPSPAPARSSPSPSRSGGDGPRSGSSSGSSRSGSSSPRR
ncbi:MAG TPA: hypothetical protein VF669_08985 [Tepidisphaeraceae bacterium]